MILLTVASVSLAAALTSFVKKVKWLAVVLLVVGAATLAVAGWRALMPAGGQPRSATASSDPAGEGAVWIKLTAPPGEGIPDQWACHVTSFSGEWQGRCSKRLMRGRGRTWTEDVVVAKFPQDIVGSKGVPSPGTYEVEWTTFVADEEGSLVEKVVAEGDFEYE